MTHDSPKGTSWSLSPRSIVSYTRNTEGHTIPTIRVTVVFLSPMALPSKEMGAHEMQERADMLTSIAQRKASMKELILLRSFERKSGKLSASNPTSARSVVPMSTKVTTSLMTAHEGAGQIAQGNQLSVRNLN